MDSVDMCTPGEKQVDSESMLCAEDEDKTLGGENFHGNMEAADMIDDDVLAAEMEVTAFSQQCNAGISPPESTSTIVILQDQKDCENCIKVLGLMLADVFNSTIYYQLCHSKRYSLDATSIGENAGSYVTLNIWMPSKLRTRKALICFSNLKITGRRLIVFGPSSDEVLNHLKTVSGGTEEKSPEKDDDFLDVDANDLKFSKLYIQLESTVLPPKAKDLPKLQADISNELKNLPIPAPSVGLYLQGDHLRRQLCIAKFAKPALACYVHSILSDVRCQMNKDAMKNTIGSVSLRIDALDEKDPEGEWKEEKEVRGILTQARRQLDLAKKIGPKEGAVKTGGINANAGVKASKGPFAKKNDFRNKKPPQNNSNNNNIKRKAAGGFGGSSSKFNRGGGGGAKHLKNQASPAKRRMTEEAFTSRFHSREAFDFKDSFGGSGSSRNRFGQQQEGSFPRSQWSRGSRGSVRPNVPVWETGANPYSRGGGGPPSLFGGSDTRDRSAGYNLPGEPIEFDYHDIGRSARDPYGSRGAGGGGHSSVEMERLQRSLLYGTSNEMGSAHAQMSRQDRDSSFGMPPLNSQSRFSESTFLLEQRERELMARILMQEELHAAQLNNRPDFGYGSMPGSMYGSRY